METMPLVRSGRAWLLCVMMIAVSVACIEAVGDDAFTYMDNGEISISFLLDQLRWPFYKRNCDETGVVKVGVDRTRGGAIGFFGPSGSDHNMINCHDMGREVTNAVHTLCFHDMSNLQPNATGPAFLLCGSGLLQP